MSNRAGRIKLLVVGGSGYVGKMVLPALGAAHEVRVFDLVAPPHGPWDYIPGDLMDFSALISACGGIDALIYLAMGAKEDFYGPSGAASQFDVNVKGLYLALRACGEMGVRHAVYASSLSVYANHPNRTDDESVTPDASSAYGLSKRLGEEVCRSAANAQGLSLNVLRLCFPTPDEEWPRRTDDDFASITATSATDTARAILSATEYRNGFETFTISGDFQQRRTNLSKASQLLGWRPISRPRADDRRGTSESVLAPPTAADRRKGNHDE